MKLSVRRLSLVVLPALVLACNPDPDIGVPGGMAGNSVGNFGGGGTSGGGSAGSLGFAGVTTAGGKGGGGPIVPGGGEMTCGEMSVDLERLPPEVLLLQDRSSSMQQKDDRMTMRWDEVKPAMNAVITATDSMVSWGMKYFPSKATPYCVMDPGAEVPVAAMNAVPLLASLNASPLVKGTPTADAIKEGAAYLKTIKTKNPKFILLATDGEPDCDVMGDDKVRATRNTLVELTTAVGAGIRTFVVGIAINKASIATLDMMATAGGTARMGTPKFYPATDRKQLSDVLSMIATEIATCVFPLKEQPPMPKFVGVTVNGASVPSDAAAGWSYGPNMMSIQLNGAACDALKVSTGKANVMITFGCKVPIVR